MKIILNIIKIQVLVYKLLGWYMYLNSEIMYNNNIILTRNFFIRRQTNHFPVDSGGRGCLNKFEQVPVVVTWRSPAPPLWTEWDRHDWKHYLPKTSLASGNIYNRTAFVRSSTCSKVFWHKYMLIREMKVNMNVPQLLWVIYIVADGLRSKPDGYIVLCRIWSHCSDPHSLFL